MSRSDPRSPWHTRPKGPIVMRRCLKCDREFEAVAHFHICQPCSWENSQLSDHYTIESLLATPWMLQGEANCR
jgi:hypothetical protein